MLGHGQCSMDGHTLRVCAFHSGQKGFFFKPHEGVCRALITVVRDHVMGWVQFWIVWLLEKEAYKLVMFCGDSGFRESILPPPINFCIISRELQQLAVELLQRHLNALKVKVSLFCSITRLPFQAYFFDFRSEIDF